MTRFRRGLSVAFQDVREFPPAVSLVLAMLAFVLAYAIFFITGAHL